VEFILHNIMNEPLYSGKYLADTYWLEQNFPNPFNSKTAISYWLLDVSKVELEIFNLLGQRIETLVEAEQSAGFHIVEWNASSFPSGIYYYRLKAGSQKHNAMSEPRKMVVLR
jgi:hypothetical protein